MSIPENLIKRLHGAQIVVIFTGAGVSAESGVATFRDPDGLWAKFNPAELASVDGFMSNPKLVWEWYQYRVGIVNSVKPNAGHFAIAEMQKILPKVHVVTQNVDRLHHLAGAENVVELHGNITTNRCFDCSKPFNGKTDLPKGQLPACESCGGLIRPNVVWFGEMLPQDAIERAEILSSSCDVFFSIGTSAEVYPAANLPHYAKQSGALVVEVNPNHTVLSDYVDIKIPEKSAVAMPKIVELLRQ